MGAQASPGRAAQASARRVNVASRGDSKEGAVPGASRNDASDEGGVGLMGGAAGCRANGRADYSLIASHGGRSQKRYIRLCTVYHTTNAVKGTFSGRSDVIIPESRLLVTQRIPLQETLADAITFVAKTHRCRRCFSCKSDEELSADFQLTAASYEFKDDSSNRSAFNSGIDSDDDSSATDMEIVSVTSDGL